MGNVSTETPVRIGLDGRILMHYEMRGFARRARAKWQHARTEPPPHKKLLSACNKTSPGFFGGTQRFQNLAEDSPLLTKNSGWYNFKMTFQKTGSCSTPNDLVTTVMSVYDANGNVVGTPTTVCSNSPGGPLNTENLMGPGYLWITVWPNGWAGDVLGFDDARADLLH